MPLPGQSSNIQTETAQRVSAVKKKTSKPKETCKQPQEMHLKTTKFEGEKKILS